MVIKLKTKLKNNIIETKNSKKIEKSKDEKSLVRIDIACGNNKQAGFIGVDKIKLANVDIVYDLNNYPYPFEDNSVDEIYCSHFIEHVNDIIKFMNELYRIMKQQSKATIIAPYYTSVRAMQDPTHKRLISEMTFLYYNKKWREDNKLEHYPITADFDFTYGYAINQDYVSRSEEHRIFAIGHYWNVVNDIQVVLTKR